MGNLMIPENLEYTEEIRKFETTDPAHADLLNQVAQALLNNEAFLKRLAEQHIDAENPHGITKETVGLGNVPNVATNDQAPTFTQAASRENIASGEKLPAIFGKIKKWLADLKPVAFTGSYNDLADKPEIPEETRVKGNVEDSYRTGNVNLTPANIGAPSNEYMGEHFVADYISSTMTNVGSQGVGWYRIAVTGFPYYNSCVITLKRDYNTPAPEYQKIQLVNLYDKRKFITLAACSNSHIWTKIRETWNEQKHESYIEVYLNYVSGGYSNGWRISIEDAIGTIETNKWKTITPVKTEESVNGFTILATLDLPAEFDPSHNIMDADNNSNISFSYHKPGLDSADWLAAWNGYELRAIAPSKITGVGSAVKATQDGDGNVIKDTYAKRRIYGDDAVSLGRKYMSATGEKSAVLGGIENIASSEYSATLGGTNNRASSGYSATLGGTNNRASSEYSATLGGCGLSTGNDSSVAQGHFNAYMVTGGNQANTTGTAFAIGNGTSESALSNAFSVMFNGVVKAKSTITGSTTADYAEFFEWLDGNPEAEDRVGRFVSLAGNKITIADSGDSYILGIVSGEPFVLGNGDCDTWNGMFLKDDFNRTIYEPAPKMELDEGTGELVPALDEDGNLIYDGTRPKLNPKYDPTQPYISRFDRKEWAPVGMLGVLSAIDDGTCVPGQFCKCSTGGIATFAECRGIDTFFVIERKAENIVSVIMK